MIAGHDLGYCWSGPEHLPGCATSVDDIENADPEERKRASEVHEFTKTFFAGSSRIFLGGRTQTSSAVYAASSVRHRCFAHCKELSNNKSKTSTSSEADFGNAFRLTEPHAKFPCVPCFLPSDLPGIQCRSYRVSRKCRTAIQRKNQIAPPINATNTIALAAPIASRFGSLVDALSESYKSRRVRAT